MAMIQTPARPRPAARIPEIFKVIAEEWSVLFGAFLHPRRLVEEVEHVRALLVEAERIEAEDPLRATMLRRRASRIGVR
jgi:hypothetical protein